MEENSQPVDDNANEFKLDDKNNDVDTANNIDSNRNDDFVINTSKKKKKQNKNKNEVNIKAKPKLSGSTSAQRIQIKNSDSRVKNIIININNPVSTIQTSQHIPVSIQNYNNNINEYDNKRTEPNKFLDMNHDNEANHFRINDKVLDAQQTKLFITINRLLTSSICSLIYLGCFLSCISLSILALVDVFVKHFYMNQVWLLIVEIIFLACILLDIIFKFLVMKSEYLKNIIGLLMDGSILITAIINFVGFCVQTDSVVFLSIHFVYWAILSIRFFLSYKSLKLLIKHQRDVRQNVEEIINFSEIMDDNNHKKSDNAAKYFNKRENKFTPTISFVDDEIVKNRKEFNLIVQEENKEENMNNI